MHSDRDNRAVRSWIHKPALAHLVLFLEVLVQVAADGKERLGIALDERSVALVANPFIVFSQILLVSQQAERRQWPGRKAHSSWHLS